MYLTLEEIVSCWEKGGERQHAFEYENEFYVIVKFDKSFDLHHYFTIGEEWNVSVCLRGTKNCEDLLVHLLLSLTTIQSVR